MQRIREVLDQVRTAGRSDHVMVVIDDSQGLTRNDQSMAQRLISVSEQLRELSTNRNTAIVVVWPDVNEPKLPPQAWSDQAPSADVILVMETDAERSRKVTEPSQATTVHIVKNRGGERGKLALDFFPAFSKFAEA